MKRSLLIGFVLVGILIVWVIPRFSRPVFGQAAAAQNSSYRRGRIAAIREGSRVAEGQIAADHKGNIYVVQAELTGADGSSGGAGAYKFVFKGYSPATNCCQGEGVHSIH